MHKIVALLAFVAFALAACGDGGGGRSNPPPAPPAASEWLLYYSEGTPPALIPNGSDYTTPIPVAPGSIHYVAKPRGAIPHTATVKMVFSITGTGTVIPKPGTDTPPATLRLYFQRAGDTWTGTGKFEFYRWWSTHPIAITNPGDYTVTEAIDPSKWTSVYDKAGNNPAAGNYFNEALDDGGSVGFTFGGQSFAGHGDQGTTADMTFVLHSYTVQ